MPDAVHRQADCDLTRSILRPAGDIRQKEEPHVTVGPLKDQAKPILGRRPASEPTLEAVSREKKGATTK
jgi:hypothetical protein